MKENDCIELADEFENCAQILQALGHPTRQHMILEMIKAGDCNGLRVGQITEKSHLSRPAVSHHIKVLKDAGIIQVRKEGTKNYYYFDTDVKKLSELIHLLTSVRDLMQSMPERSRRS